MTLEYWQASHEIEKLSHAISVLSSGLDRLWPRLPENAMRELAAIRELDLIDSVLAERIHRVAESIQAQGDQAEFGEGRIVEMLTIVSGAVEVPHHGEIR